MMGGGSRWRRTRWSSSCRRRPSILDACNGNNTPNGRIIRINIYEPLAVVSVKDGSIEPRPRNFVGTGRRPDVALPSA